MAQKCVHRGCEKTYTDADEVCRYHPGPPVFHEGQKGELELGVESLLVAHAKANVVRQTSN